MRASAVYVRFPRPASSTSDINYWRISSLTESATRHQNKCCLSKPGLLYPSMAAIDSVADKLQQTQTNTPGATPHRGCSSHADHCLRAWGMQQHFLFNTAQALLFAHGLYDDFHAAGACTVCECRLADISLPYSMPRGTSLWPELLLKVE
eukprot:scpid84105/ scgid33054/ 